MDRLTWHWFLHWEGKKILSSLVLCPRFRQYILCSCGEIRCSGLLGIHSCFFTGTVGVYLTEKRKGDRNVINLHYLKIPDLQMCLLTKNLFVTPHPCTHSAFWLSLADTHTQSSKIIVTQNIHSQLKLNKAFVFQLSYCKEVSFWWPI